MKLLLETHEISEQIQMVFVKQYQNVLQNYELTSKHTIILQLAHKKENPTMNEIAEILGVTPSAASQFVKKLEQKRYVKREVNKNNRRETFVLLDNKGRAFFEELSRIDQSVIEKYLLKLPEQDIIQYHAILKKLYDIVVSTSNT
ncbi:MarR family winged helix-turn-helix transcriptional regulator [Bacillus salitolerans]|uniref:MarR family winged helix-turn-helix transcriptional regulator n=1 Tax=Bacillus salitolerans TaxID=1437434 RepID=A0ABW4LSM6_9BACI